MVERTRIKTAKIDDVLRMVEGSHLAHAFLKHEGVFLYMGSRMSLAQ
jgi:hypothetical protein